MERDLEAAPHPLGARLPGIIGMMSWRPSASSPSSCCRGPGLLQVLNAGCPATASCSPRQGPGHWWWAIGAGAAWSAVGVLVPETGAGRRTRDALLLRLPPLGRWCATRSSSGFAGSSRRCRRRRAAAEAMVVVSESTTNASTSGPWRGSVRRSVEGEGIAGRSPGRPVSGAVTQMIRVGEDTGPSTSSSRPQQLLREGAGLQDQEAHHLLRTGVIIFMGSSWGSWPSPSSRRCTASSGSRETCSEGGTRRGTGCGALLGGAPPRRGPRDRGDPWRRFVALLGGMATAIRASDVHRKQAMAEIPEQLVEAVQAAP